MNPLRWLAKAFSQMRWSGSRYSWPLLMPRTKYDYAAEVNATNNSIVVAVVGWIARTFPEAPVQVVDVLDDGSRVAVPRHSLAAKIERPNPVYSGPLLWMATMVDWCVSGNGYWLKIRDGLNQVSQLWWAPSTVLEPRWPQDGSQYISYYEYSPDKGRAAIKIDPRDVVHFRYGIDPLNVRKGLSPLRSLLREIFTDDEAANMTASLMRNLGVPGVILSPEGVVKGVSKEDAEQIKDEWQHKFSGDRRGEPAVMTAPTKVHVLSFSPEQMELASLRRVPEERVAAVFGVSAMVVGLGAGLEHSSFTNFREAERAAWTANIIPTQRLMAADLDIQLLPDFDDKADVRDVEFDLMRVRALQADLDDAYTRHDKAVRGGWEMVSEAKRAVGLPVLPGDEVYLRGMTIMTVPPALKALPGPSLINNGRKGAAEEFEQRLGLARRRLAEKFAPQIGKFCDAQGRRALERLERVVGKSANNGGKALASSEALLPAEEDGLLDATLRPLHLAAMEVGWEASASAFGFDDPWDDGDAAVAESLSEAAYRAGRVNAETRERLDALFLEADQQGLTLPQVIAGDPDTGRLGLAALVGAWYAGRPQAIAATEAMWGTGRGQTALYARRRIQRVMMVDPGRDPPCVARNGRVVSLVAGQMALNEEHSHGRLTLVPV